MKNRLSLCSLIMIIIISIFIFVEFTNPVSSLFVLVSVVLLSVLDFICAVKGIRHDKSPLSIVVVILAGVIMIVMLFIFLIMWIMGL